MFYKGEIVVMDEGACIQCDVIFIKIINPQLCLIEDADGDLWEVELERITSINN